METSGRPLLPPRGHPDVPAALRERGGDIILLAKAFLERYADENRRKIKGFTDQAIAAIAQYEWPGNVRELENRIKRAVIMPRGAKIIPADLDMAEVPLLRGAKIIPGIWIRRRWPLLGFPRPRQSTKK